MKKIAILAALAVSLAFAAGTATASQADTTTTIQTVDTAKVGIYDQVIGWYNDNLNYGTIALLMAVESSFIPFPSELVVPPAAYKAMQPESGLNIVFIVIFATLGALAGAFINYFLAKLLGRPIPHQ